MFLFVFLNFSIAKCQSLSNNDWGQPEYRKPITPTQDSLEKWCSVDENKLVRVHKGDSLPFHKYYLNNKLYTGWACEVRINNHHKYHYSQYENGEMVGRVGYYANGQVDMDFLSRNGNNVGSARMWNTDGSLYIDTFFTEDGKLDGLQWRWYKNGVVARKALFDKGELIYELLYDSNGNLTEKKGDFLLNKN